MKIDLTKLENATLKDDGRTVARCPACSSKGGDRKGNNLVVYAGGEFACAAYSNDKAHNRKIMELVGIKASRSEIRFSINRLKVPESKVLIKIGSLRNGGSVTETGSENPTPLQE